MAAFCPEKESCPACGSAGSCHIHAYYGRKIVDFMNGVPVWADLTILRMVCGSCGHTHSILPDLIIPYCSYSIFFLLRVLAESFMQYRTTEQLCERFRITANQLHKWKKLWALHKKEWLGLLASMETSDLSFLKAIIRLDAYSDFASSFVCRYAVSFLQSHQNPSPPPKNGMFRKTV